MTDKDTESKHQEDHVDVTMSSPNQISECVDTAVSLDANAVRLANRGYRLFANIIDLVVTYALFVGPPLVFDLVLKKEIPDVFIIASLISAPLYYLLNDGLPNGQSLGKKLFRIQVIDEKTGEPCQIGRSFLRNLPMVIPLINLFDVMFIFGEKRKRLGDYWAGTIVVERL
jgi:uncharacterized RDD family membrane protein YckC